MPTVCVAPSSAATAPLGGLGRKPDAGHEDEPAIFPGTSLQVSNDTRGGGPASDRRRRRQCPCEALDEAPSERRRAFRHPAPKDPGSTERRYRADLVPTLCLGQFICHLTCGGDPHCNSVFASTASSHSKPFLNRYRC